jgi:hypothetical protein
MTGLSVSVFNHYGSGKGLSTEKIMILIMHRTNRRINNLISRVQLYSDLCDDAITFYEIHSRFYKEFVILFICVLYSCTLFDI